MPNRPFHSPIHSSVVCALAISFGLSTACPLHGQAMGGEWQTTYSYTGATVNEAFGSALVPLGDVNGDSFSDWAVGSPKADPGGLVDAGQILIYSGADGTQLFLIPGSNTTWELGSALANTGDVNQDGILDLAAGAPLADPGGLANAGSVFWFSGADGALIRRLDGLAIGDGFGSALAGGGDLDGDGVGDLLVGAPLADPQGRIAAGSLFAYSGRTGNFLWQVDGLDNGDQFGSAVSFADDLDGDQLEEVLVGAPLAQNEAGVVDLLFGADGSLWRRFQGPVAGEQLGFALAKAGDVDFDGFTDQLISAPLTQDPATGAFIGAVYVVSGLDGSVIRAFFGRVQDITFGYVGNRLGYSVAAAPDQDGDSIPDFWFGAIDETLSFSQVSFGAVYLFSGGSGRQLFRQVGIDSFDRLGSSVAVLGDLQGEGYETLIAGAPGEGTGLNLNGRTEVYDFEPYLRLNQDFISANSGGTVQFAIDFPNSESNQAYALLASTTGIGPTRINGIEVPLSNDDLFGSMTSGNPPSMYHQSMGTLNLQGDAIATVTLQPGQGAAWLGKSFWHAAVSYIPPSGVRLTSASRIVRITP